MGGSVSQDKSEDGFQDDDFPWFHIVSWCAEDWGSDVVWRWDIRAVRTRCAELTASEETANAVFLAPGGHGDDGSVGDVNDDAFTSDREEMEFVVEWAAALLEQIPTLRSTRYRLVPRKLKEGIFWKRYLAAVRRVIQQEFFVEKEGGEAARQDPEEAGRDRSGIRTAAPPAIGASAGAQAEAPPADNVFADEVTTGAATQIRWDAQAGVAAAAHCRPGLAVNGTDPFE